MAMKGKVFFYLRWYVLFVADIRTLVCYQAVEDIKAAVAGAVPIPEGEVKEVAPAVAASVKWQMNSGRFRSGVGRLMIEILRSAFKSNAVQGRYVVCVWGGYVVCTLKVCGLCGVDT